ncbi:hypothetical protein PDJAM_G00177030, partial [Pangasius djambal]|nr:hypothetical protein [Pangasius djambal]
FSGVWTWRETHAGDLWGFKIYVCITNLHSAPRYSGLFRISKVWESQPPNGSTGLSNSRGVDQVFSLQEDRDLLH